MIRIRLFLAMLSIFFLQGAIMLGSSCASATYVQNLIKNVPALLTPTFYASDADGAQGFSGITSIYLKDASNNVIGVTGWNTVQALASNTTIYAYYENQYGLQFYNYNTNYGSGCSCPINSSNPLATFSIPSSFGNAGGYCTLWINNIMMPQIISVQGTGTILFYLNGGQRPGSGYGTILGQSLSYTASPSTYLGAVGKYFMLTLMATVPQLLVPIFNLSDISGNRVTRLTLFDKYGNYFNTANGGKKKSSSNVSGTSYVNGFLAASFTPFPETGGTSSAYNIITFGQKPVTALYKEVINNQKSYLSSDGSNMNVSVMPGYYSVYVNNVLMPQIVFIDDWTNYASVVPGASSSPATAAGGYSGRPTIFSFAS